MLEELSSLRRLMPVKLSRRVDFPMLDMAGIAFYPRIFDLAHRFFEESWEQICGIDYPTILIDMEIGFPVVNINSQFHAPFRYGDHVTATIWISELELNHALGNMNSTIRKMSYFGLVSRLLFVLV